METATIPSLASNMQTPASSHVRWKPVPDNTFVSFNVDRAQKNSQKFGDLNVGLAVLQSLLFITRVFILDFCS